MASSGMRFYRETGGASIFRIGNHRLMIFATLIMIDHGWCCENSWLVLISYEPIILAGVVPIPLAVAL